VKPSRRSRGEKNARAEQAGPVPGEGGCHRVRVRHAFHPRVPGLHDHPDGHITASLLRELQHHLGAEMGGTGQLRAHVHGRRPVREVHHGHAVLRVRFGPPQARFRALHRVHPDAEERIDERLQGGLLPALPGRRQRGGHPGLEGALRLQGPGEHYPRRAGDEGSRLLDGGSTVLDLDPHSPGRLAVRVLHDHLRRRPEADPLDLLRGRGNGRGLSREAVLHNHAAHPLPGDPLQLRHADHLRVHVLHPGLHHHQRRPHGQHPLLRAVRLQPGLPLLRHGIRQRAGVGPAPHDRHRDRRHLQDIEHLGLLRVQGYQRRAAASARSSTTSSSPSSGS
jgi:hypothetical protein